MSIKSKGLKKIVCSLLLGVVALGTTTAFAEGYGGYDLPINKGSSYWGSATKSKSGNCVYNEVNLLTNTTKAEFWIAKSNKTKNSDYYVFKDNSIGKNMYAYGNFTTGYLGMRNAYSSNTEAYVDGWVNFN